MPIATAAMKEALALEYAAKALHASLHTADPGATGASEVSGGVPAYARKPITWNPGGLAPPVLGATSTATTGGTLAAATYFYVITALNAFGETLKSNEVSQVTTGVTSTVTLNWTAVTNATGYRIYRSTTTGTEQKLNITDRGAVTTYTDTGAATTATSPPTTNTTGTDGVVVSNPLTFDVPALTTITHVGLWSAATAGTYYDKAAFSVTFSSQGTATVTVTYTQS